MIASYYGKIEIVRLLLAQKGIDVHAENFDVFYLSLEYFLIIFDST